MHFSTIAQATVKGHSVTWANDGGIYMGRDLHDLLRDDLQGVHYTAKTMREFDALCKLFAL